MDDYIKREEFLKTWCESYCRPKQNCREDCSFYDAITQFPAADVRENVRGKWKAIDYTRPDCGLVRCSNCLQSVHREYNGELMWNFCPNCGADMIQRDNE